MTFHETPTLPESAGRALPVHLTSFVGRDRELDDLLRLMGTGRMLILTGAGGSGKTRLARELVGRVADRFDEVGWVDLASLTRSEELEQLVAEALRVPEQPPVSPRESTAGAIGARAVLLVLDNCEHVVDGCAGLAEELLKTCPRLTVLATSREAPGVPGEIAWLVPPLAPAEAVDLFNVRAAAVLPSYVSTGRSHHAVDEICRRLDGIPLAIELAAARIKILSPEQIASRLDDAFRLLVSTTRTGIPRHRTLRATMDWSYGLLTPCEQVLLRRLSVFAGGFSLEAAERVCAGDRLAVDDILDGMATLVDKSLVVMTPDGAEARYRLLETVRQYGAERLDEADERATFERRFADYFLDLLEGAEPTLIGGSADADALARIVAELDNLRGAVFWALGRPEGTELALRFVGAGFWLCYAVGAFSMMRHVTDLALERSAEASPRFRGRALVASGLTALAQGEYGRSVRDFEASLPLLEEAGDRAAKGVVLAKLGAALMLGGDLGAAVSRLDEALAFTADLEEREAPVVFARFWRSWAAYELGDLELARSLMATTVGVARRDGLPTALGHCLSALARIEIASSRVDAGVALAREALDIEVRIEDGWGVGLALDVVASVAARRGRHEVAARLLAGIEAHRKRIALALPGPSPLERESSLESVRAHLGPRFQEIFESGLALSTEALVRLARQELAGEASPDGQNVAACRDASRLEVRTLGSFAVAIDGEPVDPSAWGSARPRELLVYLLMHPEGRTKEQVGLAFWPEASNAQLRNNFHVTLHRLRKALGGAEWVPLVGERYRLDPERVAFDAADFERELVAARRALKRQADDALPRLEAALARYHGDFMDGESVGDWHLELRDHLRRLYLEGLREAGAHHAREGRHEAAAEAYRRALAHDGLNEAAVRSLVSALVEAGERSEALLAYQRFVDRLRRELDTEPERETLRLIERLFPAASGAAPLTYGTTSSPSMEPFSRTR